jgi:uncharacterized membrane protein YsdA (DUF1294 family)
LQFFNPLVDLALVGGGGGAVFYQQLLRHTLVHAGFRRQVKGGNEAITVH